MTARAGSARFRPDGGIAGGGAGLGISAAAMRRAAAFLGGGPSACGGSPALAAVAVPRVLANSLRELDRFLSVLIDEVAAEVRPPGLDRPRFARQRNTPNKLRRIHAALGLASPDHERLRAIGRARDRLFHSAPPNYAGAVPLPDWLRAAGIDRAASTRASLSADLRGVCALYTRLSAELVGASEAYLAAH